MDLNYVTLSGNAYFLRSSYKHLSWLTITILAAHAVIWEGLINIFGSVNYLQTIVSSRARQMAPKVKLKPFRRIKLLLQHNVSFEAFAGLVRWINGVTTINYRIIAIIDGNKSVISMDWMIFLRSHYLPVKYLLLLSGQNENGNMCPSQFIRCPSQLPQKLYNTYWRELRHFVK